MVRTHNGGAQICDSAIQLENVTKSASCQILLEVRYLFVRQKFKKTTCLFSVTSLNFNICYPICRQLFPTIWHTYFMVSKIFGNQTIQTPELFKTCLFISISELPDDVRDKWDSFVSGTLAEVNKQNTVDLVSIFKMFGVLILFSVSRRFTFMSS